MFSKLSSRDWLAFALGMLTNLVVIDTIFWSLVPGWDLSLTPFSLGVILFGGYTLCITGEDYVRNHSDQLPSECGECRCGVRQGGSEDQ